jgi:hypothetical protein
MMSLNLMSLSWPRLQRATSGVLPVSATLLIALAVGCASPAPPHPPSLHLPEIPKDLAAQRIGDGVQLHWTTPTQTTDGLAIKASVKDSMTAELCRLTTFTGAACVPVKRIPVQPGPSQTTETLPRPLTSDPSALLIYRVQIFNANGHTAGLSPEAFAASGVAPPPVEQLRATAIRDGAKLEWAKQNTSAAVELDRQPEGAPAPIAEPPAPKPTPKPLSKFKTKPAASPKPTQLPATEVKLKTPTQATDAGGTIDRTAEKNQSYRYTAQRVRIVTLAGRSLELRSLPSQPVIVHIRDTFPPQTPTGLASVPAPAEHAIDLSWEPNSDNDLTGYSVYRQEVTTQGVLKGIPLRLNTSPLVGPAYRDLTALPGQRYAYRIKAVDTSGNESAPSADVQETLREE